jgi:hypothetical protein
MASIWSDSSEERLAAGEREASKQYLQNTMDSRSGYQFRLIPLPLANHQ